MGNEKPLFRMDTQQTYKEAVEAVIMEIVGGLARKGIRRFTRGQPLVLDLRGNLVRPSLSAAYHSVGKSVLGVR